MERATVTGMRREGVFVPTSEVETHLACGWTLVDDLIERASGKPMRLCGNDEVVLMAPPASIESFAA